MRRAPFLVLVFILAMAAAACGSDGPAGVVDHGDDACADHDDACADHDDACADHDDACSDHDD